jgi:site-specific DNA recombinase
MLKAASYTRSSKDRSDVSIDAQRHRLNELAPTLDAAIVAEFSDVVMSGQDATRPGFVALKAAIQNPARGWSVLLMLDTARLSRDHDGFEQAWVHRECRRQGIVIHYAMLPSTGTPADLIMLNTMRGVDGWHSLNSKIKGIAGMRENVKRGFRAGGRAPWGYLLEHVGTGVMREGAEVRKSRLVPDPAAAPIVAAYLKGRAAGIGRQMLTERLRLDRASSTLVCVEWNALTYAGNTVWNVHAEPGSGHKRRPRCDWVIQPATHAALITENEAQAILGRLEGLHRKPRRHTPAAYLLTGILATPAGVAYHGDSGTYYRAGKGKKLRTEPIDRGILWQVQRELRSERFIAQLTRAAQKQAAIQTPDRHAHDLARRARELEAAISRMMDLAGQMTDTGPALRKIDALEQERKQLKEQAALAEREAAAAKAWGQITEDDVRAMLGAMVTDMQALDRAALKDWLTRLLDRIELDPDNLTVRMHYRITPARGVKLASPREYELIPPLLVSTSGKIAA